MDAYIYSKISDLLALIKVNKPLIHHITNYVTANDCANVVLAIGASPIMADDMEDVEDVVSSASALVLNTGTLNKRTVEAMLAAGKKANELGVPVILDPVGVGSTAFRNKTVQRIINNIKLSVIRGNISEIKSISGIGLSTKGVAASEEDITLSVDSNYGKSIAENLSYMVNSVIAITGMTDIVTNGTNTLFIENGHKMLAAVTGTGCMATSLIGAYCAVTEDYFTATVAGILTMGISGEKANEKPASSDIGNGSFKIKLIDSISQLTGKDIEERGKIREG